MLPEFSNIFLNIRTILGKDAKGTIPAVNSICFFISYTICRIIYLPMVAYPFFYATTFYDFGKTSLYHKVAFMIVFIFYIMIYLLNLYWYKFILKGLVKLLRGSND